MNSYNLNVSSEVPTAWGASNSLHNLTMNKNGPFYLVSTTNHLKVDQQIPKKIKYNGVIYPSKSAMARHFMASTAGVTYGLGRGIWRGLPISEVEN